MKKTPSMAELTETPENIAAQKGGPLEIDLTGIVRRRVKGWKGALIPGWGLRLLERLICQRELNEMLRMAYPERGSRFSRRILEHLKISLRVEGLDEVPSGEPFIFVSNHPLGGLDGIALTRVLGEHYGDDNLRVLVNDMLMNVEPLSDIFLPINKFGRQGRGAASEISAAFASGRQVLMFPAGLVSRLGDDGRIRDLEWHKAFVSKALEYGRRVVPIRFEAKNSDFFYRFARWRKKSGLRINIEQALLPRELVKARSGEFRIRFGEPIDLRQYVAEGLTQPQIAARVRAQIQP